MRVLIIILSTLSLFACTRVQENVDGPKSHFDDISITKIGEVAPLASAMALHPITKELWYICFDGDVYKVDLNTEAKASVKVFNARDHGITKLQGMAFLNDRLYLCGNYTTNNTLNNVGRLAYIDLSLRSSKFEVVFITDEYGTNKTTFDHGWNAIAISPDKQFIYVNSGSRTDHGEVQDNGGAWPNARDCALTSKIFRFPISSKNMLLPNDIEELKRRNFIFAEGLRNAFGMAFNSKGKLFAVVNSGDYDHAEDMFLIRNGAHYGFPWIMGGTRNPQSDPNWKPDRSDKFLSKTSYASEMGYFHNDPMFPKIPGGLVFEKGIQNLGPDADEFRDSAGNIVDASEEGANIATFTPHSSPVGLSFDTESSLPGKHAGKGYILRFSSAKDNKSLISPFTTGGADLLELELIENRSGKYLVKTRRLVDNFQSPIDCVIEGNTLIIMEHREFGTGNLWKVTFGR